MKIWRKYKYHIIIYYVIMLFIIVFFVSNSEAVEWSCDQKASEKIGNVIVSCGVAKAKTEAIAREKAHLNALKEFKSVCYSSVDCQNRAILVRPKRNECIRVDNQFKCWRAIEYTITNERAMRKMNAHEIEIDIRLREAELSEIRRSRDLASKKDELDRQHKWLRDDPSYWLLGTSLVLGSGTLARYSVTRVGYGLRGGYCFSHLICPGAEVSFGQYKRDGVNEGNFRSFGGLVTLYPTKQFWIEPTYGLIHSNYAFGSVQQTYVGGRLGYDIMPLEDWSVSFTPFLGVKDYSNGSTQPEIGAGLNFRF